MKLPPPIEVPWSMKTLQSAETSVERLPCGRLRFAIRHEILEGVTPRMLVWWFNNMDGTVRIGGADVPRYRAWHPRDHVALTYVRPGRDGRKFSAGAQVHIQEYFGRDPRYKGDIVDDVVFLDETGFCHTHSKGGVLVMRMSYRFTAVPSGTLYENELVVGMESALLGGIFNYVVRPVLFPERMGRAWLKHNIEEVGNLQHFLPALYAAHQS